MAKVGNLEILQIVEAVAREKGMPRDILISAMEQAIQVAAKKKYGHEHNIKVEIVKKTGEIRLMRVREVVEESENLFTQIALHEAREEQPDVKIGEEIYEVLPPIELGRVAAQAAKQIIVQKVAEIERQKQYEDFKDRKGEIINGIVKRIEFGNVIVDLGRTEAIIKKDQLIKGENFKIHDRVKAYVQDVRLEPVGPQIFLSRADEQMLIKLFEVEVPEVYEKVVEIKGVARDPGSKAKVAVYASDSATDPVGACVGIRGNRVRAITNELGGEKIDVILWSKNVAQFVINAMTPAEIAKIVIDEEKGKVEVVVPTEQLSIAIGRRGQNVRLASKLTGWNIDVMTEEQESKQRNEEFNSNTVLLMRALNIEEVLAQLLAAEGFTHVEQIAAIDISALTSIQGLDEQLAAELKNRAVNYINDKNEEIVEKLEHLGVEQELIDILELSPDYVLKLAEYGIKTIEDLGEMSVEEFSNLVSGSGLSEHDIEMLITTARMQ